MKEVFVIRTLKVAKYPPEIQCPFQVGAYMEERDTAYGVTLSTVFNLGQATWYTDIRIAQNAIKAADCAAVFEIVTFREVKKGNKNV